MLIVIFYYVFWFVFVTVLKYFRNRAIQSNYYIFTIFHFYIFHIDLMDF